MRYLHDGSRATKATGQTALSSFLPWADAISFLCFWSILSLMLLSCRTPAPSEALEAKTVITGEGFATTLEFDKNEEQSLYLVMLQVELQAGIKVNKDQLHRVTGIASCRPQDSRGFCELRVRLGERNLSTTQPLARELARKLIQFSQQVRPDLESEELIFADMECDYIGKANPPYNLEEVNCRANSPRALHEAIFDDAPAEELADLVRGETSFGTDSITLHGTLACKTIEHSQRRICAVRAIEKGLLSDNVKEISAKNASLIAQRVFQTRADLTTLAPAEAADPSLTRAQSTKRTELPREVVGSLSCWVDSSRYEAEGVRQYKCRVSI